MKKFLPLIILIVAIYLGWSQFDRPDDSAGLTGQSDTVTSAFKERKSDVQAEGKGIIIKILPDDNDGSRHQRFILQLDSGLTLLISHNIDLAPRLSSLKKGDGVEFKGEYEWNSKGGVLHWTHHDPKGRHVGGWLKHNGQTYQ